jgi:cobalt-zinc-cadmium efflux system outer membrane protein
MVLPSPRWCRSPFLVCALVALHSILGVNLAFGQPRPALLPPVAVEQSPSVATGPAPPNAGLTLDQLERLALGNNPTLAGAAAIVMQQQGVLRQAGLYPNPNVGYVRSDPDQRMQSQTQGVFVSQDIVTGGKLKLAQAAARLEVDQSNWQLQAQQARVINDVRIRFYETLGAQQAVLAALDLEKIAAEGVKTAEQLLAVKIGTRADVLQAEIQLSVVRSSVRDAQLRHDSAWRQLTAVVGVQGMPPSMLAGDLDAKLPALDWDAQVQQLLGNSPLLRSQQSQIAAFEYELRLARAQVIPNVNVQVVAQRDSTDKFSSVNTFIGLPIPIFNRNQGNIQTAEGRLLQARKEQERLQLALVDQLAGSFRQYQSLRHQADQLKKEILPRAKENLDLTLAGYKAGRFDFSRVLTARQLYFQSNLTYIDSLTELRKTATEIDGLQLTGGLNPAEVGTALQATPGAGTTGTRSILLQQLQEQRGGGSQTRPGALQANP